MALRLKTAYGVFKDASRKYGRDRVNRMAAAVSYRTVFAIAPMLFIALSISGLVLGGRLEARVALVSAATRLAGPEFGTEVSRFLRDAFDAAGTAAILGIIVLLWSSSTLFLELQRDLNDIFEIPIPDEKRLLVVGLQRGVGILWTVGIGFALILLFALNAAAQIAGDAVSTVLATSPLFVSLLSFAVSFGFMTLMFALVFQTLTFGKVPWRPIWVGAIFTAVAFTSTAYLTGVYFSTFGAPTALGITSSIIVLLFVTYLLSSVFLFGAEIARTYWIRVHGRADGELFFTEDQYPTEKTPNHPSVSLAAFVTFMVGLFVGRSRRRR